MWNQVDKRALYGYAPNIRHEGGRTEMPPFPLNSRLDPSLTDPYFARGRTLTIRTPELATLRPHFDSHEAKRSVIWLPHRHDRTLPTPWLPKCSEDLGMFVAVVRPETRPVRVSVFVTILDFRLPCWMTDFHKTCVQPISSLACSLRGDPQNGT